MRYGGGRSRRSAGVCTAIAFSALLVAACGDAVAPSSAGTPSSSEGGAAASSAPPGSTGPAITSDPSASLASDAGCELAQAPGPGDVPQGGETDVSDQGGGRWRVCLEVPLAVAVEASAWCRWDAGRTGITEISGLPASAGTVDYDAWLSFAAGAFEFHATDTAHGGLIANYAPDSGAVQVQLDGDKRGGLALFDVGLQPDPESGPPTGAPPRYGGVMRWRCGDAPAAA